MKALLGVAALLAGMCIVVAAQEEEDIRINVKDDMMQISLSGPSWVVEHGQGFVPAEAVEGIAPDAIETLLLQYIGNTLTIDGMSVSPDCIEVEPWVSQDGHNLWSIIWIYRPAFAVGIHILTNTWTVVDIPCQFWPASCDPATWHPYEGRADCDFVLVQPATVVDGRATYIVSHTMSLVVVP